MQDAFFGIYIIFSHFRTFFAFDESERNYGKLPYCSWQNFLNVALFHNSCTENAATLLNFGAFYHHFSLIVNIKKYYICLTFWILRCILFWSNSFQRELWGNGISENNLFTTYRVKGQVCTMFINPDRFVQFYSLFSWFNFFPFWKTKYGHF